MFGNENRIQLVSGCCLAKGVTDICTVTGRLVTRYTDREKQTVFVAGGSQSGSDLPTAVNHPHHHSIVLLLPAQTPYSAPLNRGGVFVATKPAFTHADEQSITADTCKLLPVITVNMRCSTFAEPQGFSVRICTHACVHSDLAPFHPMSRQYSKWDPLI